MLLSLKNKNLLRVSYIVFIITRFVRRHHLIALDYTYKQFWKNLSNSALMYLQSVTIKLQVFIAGKHDGFPGETNRNDD